MRGIVRAESPTLETKIAVRSIRRRDRPRKLRNRDGMLFVANIDNPVGKKNLVAIRVSGFSVGQHESAVENSAINRMKRDAHPGILRGRFEAGHFPLFYGIAQIKNDETVAAESPVSAVTAVLQFLGYIDWAVQACKGSLALGHLGRPSFEQIPLLFSVSSPFRDPGTHHMETSETLLGSVASTIMLPLTSCRKYAGWWIKVSSGAVSRR